MEQTKYQVIRTVMYRGEKEQVKYEGYDHRHALIVLQQDPRNDLLYAETGRCASYSIPQDIYLQGVDTGSRAQVAHNLADYCKRLGLCPLSYRYRVGTKSAILAWCIIEYEGQTGAYINARFWEHWAYAARK